MRVPLKDAGKITEAEFLRQVLQYAKLMGWKTAHFRPARTKKGWRTAVSGDGKGFPDLILIRGHVLIAAELKVGKNRTASEQMVWLLAFGGCGAEARVWRPEDWPEIERLLGRAVT